MTARNRNIQIRVNDEELKALKQRAGNIGTSTFLRRLALDQPIAPLPPVSREVIHKCDPGLIREVNRIGVNINQIAKQVNAGGKVDNAVLIALLDLQTSLDDIVARTMNDDS